MRPIEPITVEEIRAAASRLAGSVLHTPLVPLARDDEAPRILLKLESLQPIGSFKLRGAGNAMALTPREELAKGVYTASAGNMAQGLAWNARRLGIPCQVVVPEHAPQAKVAATERLGATVIRVPFDDWWKVLVHHEYPGLEGAFIHPVVDRRVIAGNGTIGLEILEDEPQVDTVIVPFGGGALSCGIASAVKAIKPAIRVLAAEVETAAPLAASLRAGSPQEIDYRPSFVDGIGGRSVLPEMWPLVSSLIDDSIVVSTAEVAAAVRVLALNNRVVAEGAGAASVAAARTGKAAGGTIACVVSGGNIDPDKLATILAGRDPG